MDMQIRKFSHIFAFVCCKYTQSEYKLRHQPQQHINENGVRCAEQAEDYQNLFYCMRMATITYSVLKMKKKGT